MEKIGIVGSVNEIVREAYKLTFDNTKSNISKKKVAKRNEISNENDLRYICMNAKKSNVTAHDALKEKGYIRDINNDFLRMVIKE